MLAANFGVDRCTLSLYDCNDAVLECLATARVGRGDIAAGLAGLRKSLDDLICSIELGTRRLSTFAPLHVCVASEEEDSSDAEDVMRASLEGAGVRPANIEMTTISPDDIACGLSVQGGVLAGDVEGLLVLNTTFFDVLLRGTKGNVFAVERNATIPLSWSERFDYSPDRNGEGVTIGRLTEVVLSESGGRGIGIPLPDGIVSSLKEVPGRTIEATIAIERDFQLTLTLKDVSSGGKWECRLEDLLEKARLVSVQRTSKHGSNAHSNETGQNTQGNSSQSYASVGEQTSASQQTTSQSPQATTATQADASGRKWFWVQLVIMAAYVFACVYIIITITEDTQSWPNTASDATTEAAVLLVRLGTLVLMGMDGKLLYDALGGLGKPASKPNEHENKNGGGMRGCLLTLGVPSIVLFVAIGVFFEFVVPWNYRVPFLFLAVLAFPLLIARLSEFSQLKWGE